MNEGVLSGDTEVVLTAEDHKQTKVDETSNHLAIGYALATAGHQPAGDCNSSALLLGLLVNNLKQAAIDQVHVVGELKVRPNKNPREVEAETCSGQ